MVTGVGLPRGSGTDVLSHVLARFGRVIRRAKLLEISMVHSLREEPSNLLKARFQRLYRVGDTAWLAWDSPAMSVSDLLAEKSY